MIDFTTIRPRTSIAVVQNHTHESSVDRTLVDSCDANFSRITDEMRRLIARKPALCFAIAIAIGGALGWLTTKR